MVFKDMFENLQDLAYLRQTVAMWMHAWDQQLSLTSDIWTFLLDGKNLNNSICRQLFHAIVPISEILLRVLLVQNCYTNAGLTYPRPRELGWASAVPSQIKMAPKGGSARVRSWLEEMIFEMQELDVVRSIGADQ